MKALPLLLITALLCWMGSAQADVLLIESIAKEPPNSSNGLLRPRSGISKAAVERKFGAPAEKIRAVGEPPISRWVYPQYTVYFEYDKVIHSTLRHPLP